MLHQTTFSRRRLIAAFCSNQSGVVAMVTALALTVLMIVGGMAIDYGRAINKRTQLQTAADAAVLAAASDTNLSETARAAAVQTEMSSRLAGLGYEASVTPSVRGEEVRVDVTASIGTSLLAAVGIDRVDLRVRSGAVVAQPTSAEISLVLDYSGSMGRNNKYQTMRDAALKLIDDLTGPTVPAAARDRVKIGMVPFSDYVYSDMVTDYIRDVHPDHFGLTVRACLDTRRYPYAVQDTTPDTLVDDSRWAAPGMPNAFRQPGPAATGVNGSIGFYGDCNANGMKEITTTTTQRVCTDWDDGDCDDWDDRTVTTTELVPADECDRDHSPDDLIDIDAEAAVSDFATDTPQCAAYSDRSLLVRPLTTDMESLKTQLNAMRPLKLTDIALGVEMGWHLLSPNVPFGNGVAYDDPETRKILVVLTDGAQTVGGFGPSGEFSIARADTNTEELCTAIKAAGIRVITVAFDLDDNAAKQRLEDCASHPSKDFYDAATASELASAFEKITDSARTSARLIE